MTPEMAKAVFSTMQELPPQEGFAWYQALSGPDQRDFLQYIVPEILERAEAQMRAEN
ncbi:MAG TPA: hypothetical protein VGD55_01215 [Acidothermaceae bacterium]